MNSSNPLICLSRSQAGQLRRKTRDPMRFSPARRKRSSASSSLPSPEKIVARSRSRATSGSSRSRSSRIATSSAASDSRPRQSQGVGERRYAALGVWCQVAHAHERVDGVFQVAPMQVRPALPLERRSELRVQLQDPVELGQCLVVITARSSSFPICLLPSNQLPG